MNFAFWRTTKRIDPKTDPSSIGNILIKMGCISDDELEAHVGEFQSRADERLGEYLVGKGIINQDHLEQALVRQAMLRGDRKALSIMIAKTKRRHKTISSTIDEITVATKRYVTENGGHDGRQ